MKIELERERLISSTTPRELWVHPTLDLFRVTLPEYRPPEAFLFRVPTTFGEEHDGDDFPKPTSARELPDIQRWTFSLAVSALEVYAGRRNPAQLAMRCHRVVYNEILSCAGIFKEVGRIHRIHHDFPLDGIAESVITVKLGSRLKAMVLRAEGLDGRWLCTALEMI